jgi:hypothetical protein
MGIPVNWDQATPPKWIIEGNAIKEDPATGLRKYVAFGVYASCEAISSSPSGTRTVPEIEYLGTERDTMFTHKELYQEARTLRMPQWFLDQFKKLYIDAINEDVSQVGGVIP